MGGHSGRYKEAGCHYIFVYLPEPKSGNLVTILILVTRMCSRVQSRSALSPSRNNQHSTGTDRTSRPRS
jgi:hypothetical protein